MLRYGAATSRRMRCVTLYWRQIPLLPSSLPEELPSTPGLYSYQGCHDAKPTFGVLYIGQAKNLARRLRHSLCERIYWEDAGKVGLYSDVWQPQLHIADLCQELLNPVEALLIAAHSPSFNNQHVRTLLKKYEAEFPDLLVINGGVKGAMLPFACGLYYLPDEWPSAG